MINNIAIENELKKSYLDYAMSVIIGRALPDVRDGLKPVHRRSLYAMRELGVFYNRPYVKSARIVGDIIGKFHPHGDTAAYDTIVRMAQDFSMRYPLVDGQGNFGSLDGDSAAAMRYTEARMTRIDREIVGDLEKNTVDFVPNYDSSLVEPSVMPCKIPNLLINGSSGIAVGMATNIPPHNLNEVINGLIALIEDPNITISELMKIITGPDFPTGGLICGRAGIREAYETGKGIVVTRALTHIERSKDSKKESIIVTEIPFQQNKAVLVEKIAHLVKDKKISSIAEVRDESDRHGLRIVLELKKDEIADIVINQLYKMTPMQKSFGIIFLAIVNNKPEVLNLKEILEHFIIHRKSVVYRRTAFELNRAEEKAHILAGLNIAISNLDEVVTMIKAARNPQEAKEGLINRFNLSEIQAQTILDMRLQRLTGLEREKIVSEYNEILIEIESLKTILGDETLIMEIIKEEFLDIRDTYGDDRRTEIVDAADELLPEDLIAPEDMVVTVTHSGYIKRNPVSLYKSQNRGGKGVTGVKNIEEDFVSNLYVASTLDTFLFFTNHGKVFWRKVYQIPLAGRIARGKAIVNLLNLADGERVAAILPVSSLDVENSDKTIMMVTSSGRIKKTDMQEFSRPLRRGKKALTINEGDEIIAAHILNGNSSILLYTQKGMCIHFHEADIRSMGRAAAGVRAIRLVGDDKVVSAIVVSSDQSILTVTENGYGKRSAIDEFRIQKRGGKGVFGIKASERNGYVIDAKQVKDDDEIIVIADSGKMIRMDLSSIRIIGRSTQGVKMINLEEGEKVVGMDSVAKDSSGSMEDDSEESN
ncbi:DNA gyrase subunit A [Desulfoprunum benzoelyticum]|uniref:DNA gyrase subunit A n=1 Tax=Desulfoprunum benzoelyticum TaxID=1506996 RepID=A0A840UP14_9BACT|nr:DNA gyrase subunit A [Desulfoprunum benzoelyticum]MBB5347502.1 DNA gyrase subunit A [Desulfoprunum benzoelyticum]MBM9529621.1 DNA gyrase subunit A [Desulfoprunum benzoelyticum]